MKNLGRLAALGLVLAILQAPSAAAEDPPKQKVAASLHGPAAEAKVEEVKALLAAGADVNEVDEYGRTPLHKVTYPTFKNPGHLKIAGLLLENGADANAKGQGDVTPLHMAEAEFVELLVKHGATLDVQDVNGQTALHHAAWLDRAEKVKLLLKAGADPTIKDKNGHTALDRAMVVTDYPRPKEVKEMLKKAMKKEEKKQLRE